MQKRIRSLLTALLLCAALALSAQVPTLAAKYPAGIDESLPRMVDGASLLMSVPVEALNARAREMALEYHMDVVIVTRRGLGGKTPMDYADDFFDYEGYGWREQATDDITTGSGVMLLLDMQERDVWISTKGAGLSVFPKSRVDRIIDAITPELGSAQYRAAFSRFLDEAEKYLEAYYAPPAVTTEPYVGKYPAGIVEESPRVVDGANLLSDTDIGLLDAHAREIIAQYEMDIVILTERGLDGKTHMDYADDFFDYGGYGWREESTDDITTGSGALLLLDMESREIWISTKGRGFSVFGDYEIDEIIDAIVPELGDGLYFEGFERFLDEAQRYLENYTGSNNNNNYNNNDDNDYTWQGSSYFYFNGGLFLFFSLVGMIIAFAVVGSMKKKHNTIRTAVTAQSYLQNFNLTEKQDIFLYSNTTSIKLPDDPPPSSGSSLGGHTSSSGSFHGGGGGSFGGGHSSSSGSSHGGGGGKF